MVKNDIKTLVLKKNRSKSPRMKSRILRTVKRIQVSNSDSKEEKLWKLESIEQPELKTEDTPTPDTPTPDTPIVKDSQSSGLRVKELSDADERGDNNSLSSILQQSLHFSTDIQHESQ